MMASFPQRTHIMSYPHLIHQTNAAKPAKLVQDDNLSHTKQRLFQHIENIYFCECFNLLGTVCYKGFTLFLHLKKTIAHSSTVCSYIYLCQSDHSHSGISCATVHANHGKPQSSPDSGGNVPPSLPRKQLYGLIMQLADNYFLVRL